MEYHSPYRLHKSPKSGRILVYMKSSISFSQLNFPNLPYKIQAIPFKLNLRKEKWLVISVYRPPLELLFKSCSLDSLTNTIDFFSSSYDNFIAMGDFNSQSTNSIMKDFMKANGLVNLIKSNTCLKGKASCIDLILTNREYSFKHSNSIETGIRDHHHLIYTMLKTTFSKAEPKLVDYRKYKTYNFGIFKVNLGNALGNCSANGDDFNQITFTLNQYALKRKSGLEGIINHISTKLN